MGENKVTCTIHEGDRPSGKKLVGAISNTNSSADILKNAKYLLHQRIISKEKKCKGINFIGPRWLALVNDYWIADTNIYKQALGELKLSHNFEKIYLVSPGAVISEIF